MITKKHILLLITLLTASNSTYPMYNSVTSWLSRAGTSVTDNRGTAALVGGACALSAVAYYAWKKLTRRAKKIEPARTPQVSPLGYVGAPYPKLHQKHKGTLQHKFIVAVYANEIDYLRRALEYKQFDINDVDVEGNTLLHYALLSDEMREATVSFLVEEAHIDIFRANDAGCIAYKWADLQGKLDGKKFAILDVLKLASE